MLSLNIKIIRSNIMCDLDIHYFILESKMLRKVKANNIHNTYSSSPFICVCVEHLTNGKKKTLFKLISIYT